MMHEFFTNMISGIETEISQNPQKPHHRKKFALQTAHLGQRLYSGKNKVVWCGVDTPFDLLNAMGITSCYVEFVGAMLAGMGASAPMLERAEQAGYSSDSCGYHRSVIGATLNGMMPIPDFLIGTTCPCSGGLATIENLARLFKKDFFVLHIPQDASLASVHYLADQIKDMVDFVSNHTGQKLDTHKLHQAIELSNQSRALMQEIYELAKVIPSPINSSDLSDFGIVMSLSFGTQESVNVATSFRDELKNRINERPVSTQKEKIRLMWLQNRIQFRNPLTKFIENEAGASIVIDELNNITWDPIDHDTPFVSMAKRAITIPFNGPVEWRVEHIKKLAKEYQVQGAINPCNWGCRQGSGARGMIAEELKAIGVPVLNLEVDCIDQRNFAEGQIKTRLQAFLEMLS